MSLIKSVNLVVTQAMRSWDGEIEQPDDVVQKMIARHVYQRHTSLLTLLLNATSMWSSTSMTEDDVKADMVCVFLALPSQSFAISGETPVSDATR